MTTTTEQSTQHAVQPETSKVKDLLSRVVHRILTTEGEPTEIQRLFNGDILSDATDSEALGFSISNKDLSSETPYQTRKDRKVKPSKGSSYVEQIENWHTKEADTIHKLTGIVDTFTGQRNDPPKKIDDREWADIFNENFDQIKERDPNPMPIKPIVKK